jgi:hypothetical protein
MQIPLRVPGVLILTALSFAAYASAFDNGFIADDFGISCSRGRSSGIPDICSRYRPRTSA